MDRAGPHSLTLLLFSHEHAFIFIFTKKRNVSSQNIWKTEKHRQAKKKKKRHFLSYMSVLTEADFLHFLHLQSGGNRALQAALTSTAPMTGAGSHLHRRGHPSCGDRMQEHLHFPSALLMGVSAVTPSTLLQMLPSLHSPSACNDTTLE